MKKEEIYKLIKNKGQRMTKQKEIILSVLIEYGEKLLSVNQIQELLPKEENINSATVYRNLQNFVEIGILETMIDEKGFSKYVIRCHHEHHHHMICTECGRMITILCDKDRFSDITIQHGFVEEYHSLEIYGRCRECAEKQYN